jgi:membrane fusion protein, multidrug efflux system
VFELDSRVANVAVSFAEKNLQRQKQLLQGGGTSEKAVQEAQQQLESAQVQRSLLNITSPLAGTITQINVRPGQAVDLSTIMAEVIDFDRLVVNAAVPVNEATALQPGHMSLVLAETSDTPVMGTLTYIGNQVDANNGTLPVRVSLPVKSGLRSGQFVSLRIVSEEHESCFVVPLASLAKNEDGESVISIVENNVAHQTPVEVGIREDGWVEVVADGLHAGMVVVTDGAYALPEETRVHVIAD